jgi:hypothetical protein
MRLRHWPDNLLLMASPNEKPPQRHGQKIHIRPNWTALALKGTRAATRLTKHWAQVAGHRPEASA